MLLNSKRQYIYVYCSMTLHVYRNISQQLFYYINKCSLCISCHFIPLKSLKIQMDHAKLLDVLTSLPVSHVILPRAMCFAKSRPANHAICSFIDSRGYASGPIRRFLFIDYIIKHFISYGPDLMFTTYTVFCYIYIPFKCVFMRLLLSQ